jgi:hypothetical protein
MSTQKRFAREYCERAHQRARAERDKRSAKSEGPRHCNGKALQTFNPYLESTYHDLIIGQLDDQNFFARFSKARFRLRGARPDDGLPREMTALLQVLVARSPHGLKKTFVRVGGR